MVAFKAGIRWSEGRRDEQWEERRERAQTTEEYIAATTADSPPPAETVTKCVVSSFRCTASADAAVSTSFSGPWERGWPCSTIVDLPMVHRPLSPETDGRQHVFTII